MMMKSNSSLVLGYDLDDWKLFGIKSPVSVSLTPGINNHVLLCGLSGSGKSYQEHQLLMRLIMAEQETGGEFFFADYKQDDTFAYLRSCPRYFGYKDTLKALDIVHSRLIARQSGEDTSRHPITLIWDEYMAQMLNLISEDKKAANGVAMKVSEILMLGRSLGPVRLVMASQSAYANVLPGGSRMNFGVIIVVGAAIRSIYEMLLPDHMEQVKGRQFGRGEGVVLLQGSELRFIKVPTIRDENRMRQICMEALNKPL